MSTPIETPCGAIASTEAEYRERIARADYALSAFELAVLPHLRGTVLELGCGLGNLALAAAEHGCQVVALDASPTAIADLARRARERLLPIEAHVADLRHYVPGAQFDCVAALGLLDALPASEARGLLARLCEAVRPSGLVALSVRPGDQLLLEEVGNAFADWQALPVPGHGAHCLIARRFTP